jgi:histidinol phosphatase-like enzyme (inositol monophosphatase family)
MLRGAMDTHELEDVLAFAVEAAQLAGAYTLGFYNAGTPHEMKADNTPVTAADKGAEERLRARIERAYPDHGILGEELGEKPGRAPGRWILDPIDGTFSFICGVPLYCNLVGFEWQGEMVAGVIHMPALGETVWAARGLGCWWNGRRARVSSVRDPAQARLLSAGTKLLATAGRLPAYERLRAQCYADRGWCDGYAYALVATGRAEIVLDPQMSIWDCAAVMPCVREAGGTFTDWRGNATHTAPEAVATNGHLFDAVMQAIRG